MRLPHVVLQRFTSEFLATVRLSFYAVAEHMQSWRPWRFWLWDRCRWRRWQFDMAGHRWGIWVATPGWNSLKSSEASPSTSTPKRPKRPKHPKHPKHPFSFDAVDALRHSPGPASVESLDLRCDVRVPWCWANDSINQRLDRLDRLDRLVQKSSLWSPVRGKVRSWWSASRGDRSQAFHTCQSWSKDTWNASREERLAAQRPELKQFQQLEERWSIQRIQRIQQIPERSERCTWCTSCWACGERCLGSQSPWSRAEGDICRCSRDGAKMKVVRVEILVSVLWEKNWKQIRQA